MCFFGAVCAFAGDKSNPKSNDYVIALPQFGDVPIAEGDKAADAAVQAYDDAVANLLSQLRGAKTNNQKTLAIYVLGSLRAKAAIFDLVKMIDFQADRGGLATRTGRWGPYPAQDALSKIGDPAVSPILDALGNEDNKLRRQLMVMVLDDCYGTDVSIFVLKKRAESAPEQVRARYEKAISMINGWKEERIKRGEKS